MTTLHNLGLCEAAAAIRDGAIKSSELVRACLDRIASIDGGIGAFTALDPHYAMQQAEMADRARASGNGIGPLHGVPIGVKDVIDTQDLPTENGSPIFAGRRPTTDAFAVAALRAAGAIILGKTTSTELALLTPSAVRNPVDREHSPGGSSAGSAAAVASHMLPAALGTQTAGSVLRPASYCGVHGFKPTFGLVSRRGVLMQSHTLDTLGVLTRSIADAALLVDCMAAHDPDDDTGTPPTSRPRLADIAASEPPLPPLFAFVKTPAWAGADPRLHDAFAELVDVLGPERVHEVELPFLADVIEWHRIVQLAETAAYYGPLLDRFPGRLSTGLTERLELGASVPVRQYIEAVQSRVEGYAAVRSILERYTAILTPAAPGPAPKLDEGITGSPIFNGLWTYLGMPAVSLPLLEVDGLPVGVQLVGLRQDDGRLLRTARWLERHLQNLPA
ncbi:MAG: amidase [Hyphomicrobiaceae bacterium]